MKGSATQYRNKYVKRSAIRTKLLTVEPRGDSLDTMVELHLPHQTMELLLLVDNSAEVFHENNVTMFHVRIARMYLGKSVKMSRASNARMSHVSNAKMFPDRYLVKSAIGCHVNSVAAFLVSSARMYQDNR